MTNQQIAEKSNLPESTVARIFSGKTPNPTIATAVSMARAMGGSAADFMNEEDEAATVRPSSSAPEWRAGTVQSDAATTPSASENTSVSTSIHGCLTIPSRENVSCCGTGAWLAVAVTVQV